MIQRTDHHALRSASVAELSPAVLALLAQHGLLKPLFRQIQLQNALAQERLQEEERQQVMAAFAQERQLGSAEELDQWRQEQLLSRDALFALIERPLRLRRHCERLFRPKAEARFLDRKNQLDRVVYSLIRLADEGLARELYLRLDEGESNFADLAAEFSEGPERSTRGVVGPAPLTQAHPLLVERLRTATPGVVQEPFRIERWWLVFRLESLTPATFDEAMAQQMSQELFEEWLEAEVSAELNALRSQLITPAEEGMPA
jgi:parvulin-like peptidyl-prolyl isomerase